MNTKDEKKVAILFHDGPCDGWMGNVDVNKIRGLKEGDRKLRIALGARAMLYELGDGPILAAIRAGGDPENLCLTANFTEEEKQ